MTRVRRKAMIAVSAVAATAMVATAVATLPNANADRMNNAPAVAKGAPTVVPSLASWTPGQGNWTLGPETRITGPAEFAASADLLAKEIATYRKGSPAAYVTDGTAGANDIAVSIDASRTDLDKEGYELSISGDGVKIVGATKAGAFYGTRTVSQLLRQNVTMPAGSTVDKPKYAERGLTISSFEMHHTEEWIDRMLVQMADLKLNQVLLQIAVKSDRDPIRNRWSYYTKDQVRSFVKKAKDYGIEVIPEVNGPGHISTLLAGHPEYQLVDDYGKRHDNQLDVCNPDAVQYYLDVMDEYIEVFQPRQWNVGADEYMLKKDPNSYQGLINCVRERYGDDAVIPGDPQTTISNAVFDFVNTVNKHAKKRGLNNIRVWNDGIHPRAKVQLDKDIIVEHWVSDGISAQALVDRGYKVQNATARLYEIRFDPARQKGKTGEIDTEQLWHEEWNPGLFFWDEQVDPDNPQLTGAKVSMWPDDFYAITENQQEHRVREGMAMMAQMTWTATKGGKPWSHFENEVHRIGRSPEWMNVDDQALKYGEYRLSLQRDPKQVMAGNAVETGGAGSVNLIDSGDRYYQLQSTVDGRCLTLVKGWMQEQGVILEKGAVPTQEKCGNHEEPETNKQKWQILREDDGSFTIRHALSGMTLAVTTGEQVDPQYPDGAPIPSGRLGQLPSDMTQDRWLIEPLGDTPQPNPTTPKVTTPGETPAPTPTAPASQPGLPTPEEPTQPGLPTPEQPDPTVTQPGLPAPEEPAPTATQPGLPAPEEPAPTATQPGLPSPEQPAPTATQPTAQQPTHRPGLPGSSDKAKARARQFQAIWQAFVNAYPELKQHEQVFRPVLFWFFGRN